MADGGEDAMCNFSTVPFTTPFGLSKHLNTSYFSFPSSGSFLVPKLRLGNEKKSHIVYASNKGDRTMLMLTRTSLDFQAIPVHDLNMQRADMKTDCVVLLDQDGTIRFASGCIERYLKYAVSEIQNQRWQSLLTRESVLRLLKLEQQPDALTRFQGVKIVALDKDGEEVPLRIWVRKVFLSEMTHVFIIEGRFLKPRDRHLELAILPSRDSLTGLPGRARFIVTLDEVLNRARFRPKRSFAVLSLDLDRFKLVNEGLGHALGDRVLVEVARRIAGNLRKMDTVARVDGDEFVVLLEEVSDRANVMTVVRRIQADIARPILVGSHEIVLSVSVGIVFWSGDHSCAEHFIRDAETAMHKAKSSGNGQCCVFDSAMHFAAVKKLHLEGGLRKSIHKDQLVLCYQPVVDLQSQKVVAVEALLRWDHPELGRISPLDFIPMAEETGFIVPMGAWVLKQACMEMQTHARNGTGTSSWGLCVNVSFKQLLHEGFDLEVEKILEETGFDPAGLTLEITESTLITNPRTINPVLKRLKKMGIRLAMDDFGTGYSSLGYLYQFPFDTLKIDRSFVSELETSPEKHGGIIRTIISMAQNMDMDIVAEGIETSGQLEHLLSFGCRFGQGFLFSKPVEMEKLLDSLQLAG